VGTTEEASAAGAELGYPCVLKPLMSSSGHGQSVVKTAADMAAAWTYVQVGARAGAGRCIVEGFIRFDYEITVLTVAASNGIQCCPAVGHVQIDGDYRESWQPCPMSPKAWEQAQVITGLVTIGSQQLSEFALHARAILGLPVPPVVLLRPANSVALLGYGDGVPVISGVAEALAVPESQLRLFGKPECRGHRRLGVAVATGTTAEEASERARAMAAAITITVG